MHTLVVSVREAVWALLRAGFHETRAEGVALLQRGHRVVTVPDVAWLAPEMLQQMLHAAGLPFSEFLAFLDEAPAPDCRKRRPAPRRFDRELVSPPAAEPRFRRRSACRGKPARARTDASSGSSAPGARSLRTQASATRPADSRAA
jgi:hypothetical protein